MQKSDQNLSKLQATVNGMDYQQLKITNMLLGRNNQDQNILYQRCLYILSLEERTLAQAKQLQIYFEKQFQYIYQIRGQLDDDLYLKLFKNLMLERASQYSIVFEQGEKGRKMYFILEGEVGILIPNDIDQQVEVSQIRKFDDFLTDFKLVAVKKKYDHFGEIAIEQRVPRTATAIAKSDCVFATLSYEAYQSVLGLLQEQIMQHKSEILQQIAPFKHWSQTSQYVFLHNCQEITYQNILYMRYNVVDYVYIIIEGEILVQKWDQNVITTLGLYSNGQVIGDYEIYLNNLQCPIRRCTQAKCTTQTKVLRVPILTFIENMKNNQTDEWLITYYQDKFNKKWLNHECIQILRNSISPQTRDQYILPKQNKNQHILRKISQPLKLDETLCHSPQQIQYKKYCNSVKMHSPSLHYIIKNMKKKVQNYQDRFQGFSGIHSVSLQRRRCQSRIEGSFQTYLMKPSTCKLSIIK